MTDKIQERKRKGNFLTFLNVRMLGKKLRVHGKLDLKLPPVYLAAFLLGLSHVGLRAGQVLC